MPPVAIIHPDLGYSTTSFDKLKLAPNVTLQTWGILEIKGSFADKPPFFIRYAGENGLPGSYARIHFDAEPKANAQGMAEFSHLVEGRVTVGVYNVPMRGDAIQPLFKVESGKRTQVDLQKGKRAVTGKVRLPSGLLLPNTFYFDITPQIPSPPMPDNLNEDELRKWKIQWAKTPEGKSHFQKSQTMQVKWNQDRTASFCCEYVSPGKYEITGLFLRQQSKSGEQTEIAGRVKYQFELPEGSTDFELGMIEAKQADAAAR